MLKACAKCSQVKATSEFGRHARQKDGLTRNCTACQREYFAAYRDANREAERERAAKYRDRNPEAVARRHREFHDRHPNAELAYSAAYRERHPERRKDAALRYARENGEKQKASAKVWRDRNRAKLAAKSAARRAIKARATPAWAIDEDIKRLYEEAQRISRETGIEHHVDHIVPLKSKLVCGLHCEANLQILRGSENLSKCNRHWPDMP